MPGVLDTTLCDKVLSVTCDSGYSGFCHDITEILLKVALNTITLTLTQIYLHFFVGNIKDYKHDPETSHKYEKLKYVKRYHHRYGKEALLHRQSKQRRIAVSEGANYRPPSYPKCINIDGSIKCTERALPLSKYCSKRILIYISYCKTVNKYLSPIL